MLDTIVNLLQYLQLLQILLLISDHVLQAIIVQLELQILFPVLLEHFCQQLERHLRLPA